MKRNRPMTGFFSQLAMEATVNLVYGCDPYMRPVGMPADQWESVARIALQVEPSDSLREFLNRWSYTSLEAEGAPKVVIQYDPELYAIVEGARAQLAIWACQHMSEPNWENNVRSALLLSVEEARVEDLYDYLVSTLGNHA